MKMQTDYHISWYLHECSNFLYFQMQYIPIDILAMLLLRYGVPS